MKFHFAGGLCLALCAAAFAQQVLTNESVEKMAKARLGDDVIVSMIQSQAGRYDVTPDALIALKKKGISDKVTTRTHNREPTQLNAGVLFRTSILVAYFALPSTGRCTTGTATFYVIPAFDNIQRQSGGLFVIVAHDGRAFSARVMGTKSPIFVIEHLQFFDRSTGATLLRTTGFESIAISSLRNRQPDLKSCPDTKPNSAFNGASLIEIPYALFLIGRNSSLGVETLTY
jgi:hypothetical protein